MKVLPRPRSTGRREDASRTAGQMVDQAQETVADLAEEARQMTRRRARKLRRARARRSRGRGKPVAIVACSLAAVGIVGVAAVVLIRRRRRSAGDQPPQWEEARDGQRQRDGEMATGDRRSVNVSA